MRIIGLTMAKGGSVRLPRKNLLPFAGRPLLEWTLIAMKASRYLTDFYMVTESDEIADLARRYHFEIVQQSIESAKTAGHLGAPICEKIFVDATRHIYGATDVIVNPLPTSPCRKPEDIDIAVAKYLKTVTLNPGQDVSVATANRRKDIALYDADADGKMAAVLFENRGRYLTTNGSLGIKSFCYASKYAEYTDAMHAALMAGQQYPQFPPPPDIETFTDNEPWQQWDIDRREDFDLCEQLFVTNGLGDEAYARYNLGRKACL